MELGLINRNIELHTELTIMDRVYKLNRVIGYG
jgi:hypothetical protein